MARTRRATAAKLPRTQAGEGGLGSSERDPRLGQGPKGTSGSCDQTSKKSLGANSTQFSFSLRIIDNYLILRVTVVNHPA